MPTATGKSGREDFPFIPINQYVGLSNYPDQVRKKNSLRGFSFNLMVLGESGLGKTTFVNSMFNSDILPVRKGGAMPEKKFTTTSSSTLSFCSTRAQIREGEETLNLTVVEAKGFGDQLDNQQSWIPILDEIQRRNEEYLRAEFSPHPIHLAADERIHACIYFVAPLGCGLRKLDVEVMQKIGKAVNLIPVIAKADTFTLEELREFKVQVLREIEHFNIQVYQPVPKLTPTNSMQMNEELELLAERITNKIPFAVVGSNESVFLNEYEWRARQYPWGNVLVEAAEEEAFHDFLALRQLLIGELMVALKEHAEQNLYAEYRAQRLQKEGIDFYLRQQHSGKSSAQNESNSSLPPVAAASQEANEAFEKKKEAALEVIKSKISQKEAKIVQVECELMAKYRDIMDDLAEKRIKFEQRLKNYL